LIVEGGVKKMKIARIIYCELDSTLRPTIKRGFDIIPAQQEFILLRNNNKKIKRRLEKE
jgi:hypothetical protein